LLGGLPMTGFGKFFVVLVAMIFIFMIVIGIAYIVYLKQGAREVAATMAYLLNL
jgi:heme/copper-type cytochrome/quinol oxidase subunit 2